jgi:hypothetical protein
MNKDLSRMNLLLNETEKWQQSSQNNSADSTIAPSQHIVAQEMLAQGSFNIEIFQLINLKTAIHLIRQAVEKEAQIKQLGDTSTGKEIVTAVENAERIINGLIAASAARDRDKTLLTNPQLLSDSLPTIVDTLKPSEELNEPLNEAKAQAQVNYSAQFRDYLDDEEIEKALAYASEHIDKIDVNYQEGILLLRVAESGNLKLIELLLKELDKIKSELLLEALQEAAYQGHEAATELLFDYFIKKHGNSEEVLKKLEYEIKLTETYDHYKPIKELFDRLFHNYSASTEKG